MKNLSLFEEFEYSIVSESEVSEKKTKPKKSETLRVLKKYNKQLPYCRLKNGRIYVNFYEFFASFKIKSEMEIDLCLKIEDLIFNWSMIENHTFSASVDDDACSFIFENGEIIKLDVFNKCNFNFESENENSHIMNFNKSSSDQLNLAFSKFSLDQRYFYFRGDEAIVFGNKSAFYSKISDEAEENCKIEFLNCKNLNKLGLVFSAISSNLKNEVQFETIEKIKIYLSCKFGEFQYNSFEKIKKFENEHFQILPKDFFEKLKFAFSTSKCERLIIRNGKILNSENSEFLGSLDFEDAIFFKNILDIEEELTMYLSSESFFYFCNINKTLQALVGKVECLK